MADPEVNICIVSRREFSDKRTKGWQEKMEALVTLVRMRYRTYRKLEERSCLCSTSVALWRLPWTLTLWNRWGGRSLKDFSSCCKAWRTPLDELPSHEELQNQIEEKVLEKMMRSSLRSAEEIRAVSKEP